MSMCNEWLVNSGSPQLKEYVTSLEQQLEQANKDNDALVEKYNELHKYAFHHNGLSGKDNFDIAKHKGDE